MLRLPKFTFHIASTLQEAAKYLSIEGGHTRVVAGGTDLWPNMKRRHQLPETVVSLMKLSELRQISTASGELRIGSTVTLDAVADDLRIHSRYPALARAVLSISSPPLRNMGTIGGNLCLDTRCTYYNQTEEWRRSIDYCMKEAGKICWVAPSSKRCLAHSASDSAPILCALDARVRLYSTAGDRTLPVDSLFRDDGINYLAKRNEEIVTEILIPQESDSDRCKSSFWKLRRRGSIDFAVLSAAVALWLDAGGRVERARIFLGAVASQPVSAVAAADSLIGKLPDETAIREAADLAKKAATPFDNTDFQAQWRKAVVSSYVEAALREAVGLPTQRLAPNHLL